MLYYYVICRFRNEETRLRFECLLKGITSEYTCCKEDNIWVYDFYIKKRNRFFVKSLITIFFDFSHREGETAVLHVATQIKRLSWDSGKKEEMIVLFGNETVKENNRIFGNFYNFFREKLI